MDCFNVFISHSGFIRILPVIIVLNNINYPRAASIKSLVERKEQMIKNALLCARAAIRSQNEVSVLDINIMLSPALCCILTGRAMEITSLTASATRSSPYRYLHSSFTTTKANL